MPKTLPLASGIFDDKEPTDQISDKDAARLEADDSFLLDGEKDPSFKNSVDASTIAAPGIVVDKFTGKTWTLPTGTFADAGLSNYRSPRDFKKDPNFHYQVCRVEDELEEYIARGYVPVTREEVGMEQFAPVGEPKPLDKYYVIEGKDIAIKIPRQFAERDYAMNREFCDGAVRAARKEGMVTRSTAQGRFSTREQLAGDGVDSEFALKETQSRTEPVRVSK